ncbi:MAG: hypothetical protein COA32_16105 [Fluviicola sp.]|nr:MAG: hypothetical protein COA32_16105 [Fluviicola sp.]
MKNIILFSLLLSFVFFACSDNEEDSNSANAVAEFEIDGMVCEMGCGTSLKKGLFETGFVSEVKVDYADENSSNSIKIYFNKDNISTTKMEEIIELINDKQFKANLISTKDLSSSDQQKYKERKSNSTAASPSVEASTKSFSFPNITKLLNNLIY